MEGMFLSRPALHPIARPQTSLPGALLANYCTTGNDLAAWRNFSSVVRPVMG